MSKASTPLQAEGSRTLGWIKSATPNAAEASLVAGSALLTILSFPDFDLWFLAWFGLTPLLIVVAGITTSKKAFVAGWLWGTIFFYGTCWWLTYPMIHYARISAWLAYPLLLLPIMLVALFPALGCALTARVIARFGSAAVLLTPLVWVAFEWLRYVVTGQLWNAIGYSQAFHPTMIHSAQWGGVYLVGFLVVMSNAAVAFCVIEQSRLRWIVAIGLFMFGAAHFGYSNLKMNATDSSSALAEPKLVMIAIQPNVPMDLSGDSQAMNALLERHLSLSRGRLNDLKARSEFDVPVKSWTRLVIWPESPMNFSYSRDPHLRQVVSDFARENHTSILLNSLEPAKNSGDQNSAILVNELGELSARYDKIRLMPFGEYVPLPHWLPGASSVRGIVGEFTPGNSYTLMPLGALRAGVFICIEAAHPGVARNFTNEGANVLINISNDGYLGPTPVMRQHLANAIFRAVENDRNLVRVTNTGITAFISSNGAVSDQTEGFQEAVRTWTISKGASRSTFYTRHGDLFVYGCALISLGIISASFMSQKPARQRGQVNREARLDGRTSDTR